MATLILEPGDIALWSPYLVHASGTNTATHLRRFYINGYVRAEDCDRGEWTFRDADFTHKISLESSWRNAGSLR